ncbi:hypothetical protein AJ80_07930 [Polytolypa hystricis UAMH7299]|uniref:Uncharacterized protein n=1 Tax=Polytolypa hystricis (strain UAMH7299) TaxID=1447883 RepID=A0A2B7XGB8_POLH7|nr:hypothetical protein AJ80_07930 [Polytolypa hystricis UAMH7299]
MSPTIRGRVPMPLAYPAPLPPENWIPLGMDQGPTLVKRSPADSTSTSSARRTCGPDETTGFCERYTDSSTTQVLPIVLGAVIPGVVAIIVLLFLHRRHVKKLRKEDANDKHKSLDFGLEVVRQKGEKGNAPEMSVADAEKSVRGGRGISLDLSVTSPYLLPPGLNGSRESLHSLSRSMHADDDKYRPATSFSPGDNGSMRSFRGNHKHDDGSSYTGASSRFAHGDDMQYNLLRNAQRMSASTPPLVDRSSPDSTRSPVNAGMNSTHQSSQPIASPEPAFHPEKSSHLSVGLGGTDFRKSNDYLGAFIQRGPSPAPNAPLPEPPSQDRTPPVSVAQNEFELHLPVTSPTPFAHQEAPTSQPAHTTPPIDDDTTDYGDARRASSIVLPQVKVDPVESDTDTDKNATEAAHHVPESTDDSGYQFDTRRLTVGIRPLPPDDPSDNPEQRANRIRSFYKEYFDESKPAQEEYYEDYDPASYAYMNSDADPYLPDPAPFAQPMERRAMTPPPRMPPQFQSRHQASSSAYGFGPGPGPRAFSSSSGGAGPRTFSSASGRMAPPRKPRAPPSPLHVLPTPHKLKDHMEILPIDFAPGPSLRDRRAGRPETPLGGLQPYSQNLPSFVPLASSYDDLAAMPSPHALRKSATYTALDFAPPPRFKNSDTGSDAGSIRSNRSGVSAMQVHNIRTGAYRVSRLPAETVGTLDDLKAHLRPTMDMR